MREIDATALAPPPPDSSDDTAQLRRIIRELVALLSVPSIWVGSDLKQSLQSLTDVTRAALRATKVCLRVDLPNGTRFETGSVQGLSNTSPAEKRDADILEAAGPGKPSLIRDFNGHRHGKLTLVSHPFFFSGRQAGYLVACYAGNQQQGEMTTLVLQVAANQATILLQRFQDQEEYVARKIAEDRLRQSESQYEHLVRSIPAAVYTCDENGKIKIFNEAALDLWGRRPEMGEDHWCGSWKIFDSDGTPMPHESCPMAVALKEGRSLRGEIVVERPDGTRSNVLAHPEPIRDVQGKVIGAVNMLVDVSDIRRTQIALRNSESRLHSLLTLMPAAVYVCDAEGRIVFFNRRAAQLWGEEPELNADSRKFCGAYRCWFQGNLLQPDETPMAISVREGKAFRDLEPVFERADGVKVPVLVNIDPLFDEKGKPAGAINVFQDVSRLKEVEQELKVRTEHLQAIIDTTPECVKLVARDGTLLAMNGAGLCFVEADSAEQVIGANVYNLIVPEMRDAFRQLNERVCDGNKEHLEFQIVGLKGTRRWMETNAVPILDPKTAAIAQLAITRDVTQRKLAEEALSQRTRCLEILNQLAQTLAGELNLGKLVQSVADAARQISQASFAAFFYREDSRDAVSIAWKVSNGSPDPEFPSSERFGCTEFPLITGPSVRVADLHHESAPAVGPAIQKVLQKVNARSCILVPVVARSGETLGRLLLAHPDPAAFGTEIEKTVAAIGTQTAIAIENAHLYEALNRELAAHKRAEEALRESEKSEQARRMQLETLMEAVPAVVWVAGDRECREITGNRAGYDFLRAPFGSNLAPRASGKNSIPGVNVYKKGMLLADEELPMHVVARTGKPLLGEELEHRYSDGTSRWLYGNVVPLAHPSSGIDGVLATFVDITDRKQSEEAMYRLGAIVESSEDAIVSKDLKGIIRTWNSGAERLFGYRPDEVVGKPILLVIPPDRTAEETMILDRVGRGEKVVQLETIRRKKDGTLFDVSITVSPIKDPSGRIIGVSKIARDITPQKQMERSKDQFFAILSHELRTPLSPLLLCVDMLRRADLSPQDQSKALDRIERNVKAEVRLVDELLDLSKIVHRKLELQLENLSAHELVHEVVGNFASKLENHRFSATFGASKERLLCDRLRIQQVLSNLLDNAVKFTPRGGTIALRTSNVEGTFVIALTDSGRGFEGDPAKLFLPFEQEREEIQKKYGGLGLGLAICTVLVQSHGGRIAAESPGLDQGATFTVTLPLAT